MRILTLVLFSIVVAGGSPAQSDPPAAQRPADSPRQDAPEEVVVRGRRLTELRFEVELAQERAYAIFNEINSDDDFDVYCREERRYHSRATRRICRAQFEQRISAEAAKEYMAALRWTCQPSADANGFVAVNFQACLFSSNGQSAAAAARSVEVQLPTKHEQMNDEIVRLANQDDRFAQAILDWYETNQQYEEARKRRDED
jgi:hypothetical protein